MGAPSIHRCRSLAVRRRLLTLVAIVAAALSVPAGSSPATSASVTVAPSADALVSSAALRANFGRSRRIGVDRRPSVRTYLRFRVRGLAGPVRLATLRLYALQTRGHGLRVAALRSHAWTETRLTYANAPRLGASVRTQVPGKGWVSVDVTRLVRRTGTVDLALANTSPSGKIVFASRETRRLAPRLVVSSAATKDPVIAAAGNIACDPTWPEFNGGNGTSTDCQDKATAAVLARAPRLAAVLTLGDAQYGCGGLSAYQQAYGPTWGRFLSITHPTPGNHDYASTGGSGCDPSGRAGGYFSYFGPAAGQYGRNYYSFDVGKWHVISLDSQCSAVGGCGVGSPEETWLRQDLAAHPAKCTLAYWHYPVFSSGIEGSRSDAAQFWADLDQAGADVVLSAHEHDYERFAPQHLDGIPSSKGIREFIVGTGGRMRHAFGTVRRNSQVRDNSTWGILELTLHPSSYDWRFAPTTPGGFTDSGSTACY